MTALTREQRPGETIRDFFDIPDQVRKGDFVLKLSEGVEHVEQTVRTYVATPGIVDAFAKALGLMDSALRDTKSQASYIYGSFGSGKSHFMAMLSLLLDNNETAWRVPEFHELRAKHSWVGTSKLLQLRFHMLGQPSLEAAVLGEYVRFVRREHPTAQIPPVFADEALFADAERHRQHLGNEKFFAPLNADSGGGEGWGDIGAAAVWDESRFHEASASTDPDARAQLFDALVRTYFQSYAQQTQAFVDFDSGLGILGRHAKSLGYNGVVFFLDELVLWLASRAGDSVWIHAEVPKLGKLVEAQDSHREIPIVSFVARQRNLAELVGQLYAGTENALLNNALQYWEGRIDTISLEDRNLPAIAEKRVLRPKDDAAKKRLDEAFESLKRAAGASWATLLGRADGADFRKLYPFSPALVETLVALSNSLQRERTAIKLLMELLVEHMRDLQLGQLVPVGDMFDVLAGGDETADGMMKARFESAKHLYKQQLLPMIREANGTTDPIKCQRLRPEHPARIGCSNCPQMACRNDNRLVKTVLIASLVPEVPSLKDLTASRLVQLNHGTLKAPIPGTEAKAVMTRLRQWARRVGQIHVSQQDDPTVTMQLEGVDLGPILEQAADHDNQGKRQQLLRDLLLEKLDLATNSPSEIEHAVFWRETKRKGHVRFGNVRRMTAEQLRCPDTSAWRLVIDYPFDDAGFGPNDDLQVIEKIKEEGTGTWTLVWLPSFFSDATNRLVREVVILDHILETRETTQRYIQHLSIDQQTRATSDLRNLREQKRAHLGRVLEQAYGLAKASEDDLDSSRSLDSHVFVLKPGAQVQETLAATFAQALQNYIAGLLEARWPRHPNFKRKLSTKKVAADVLDVFGLLLDTDNKKLEADKEKIELLKGTLAQIGLVRTTETSIHYMEDGFVQDIERKREQRGSLAPTVGELASWIDDTNKMGLEPEAFDVVIRAYARATARTLVRNGKAYTALPGTALPDDVVLERPELPGHAEWAKALELAGGAFGITLSGKAIHADNLRQFEDRLNAAVNNVAADCAKLPVLLREWCATLRVEESKSDRLTTAHSADELCSALRGQPAVTQVRVLAAFEPKTSRQSFGTSISKAKACVAALEDELIFGVFQQLLSSHPDNDVLEEARKALRQDETHQSLADRLRALAKAGQAPIQRLQPPVIDVPSSAKSGVFKARGRTEALAKLQSLIAEVEAAPNDELELHGSLTLGKTSAG